MIVFCRHGLVPRVTVRDVLWFFLTGSMLFLNQLFYITGIKLANGVIGSAWQPSQPIFVMLICCLLGWEKLTIAKVSCGGTRTLAPEL